MALKGCAQGGAGSSIGLAAVDLSTGDFLLETLEPERIGEALSRLAPSELVYPSDADQPPVPGEVMVTSRERWEFDAETPDDVQCRNHMHFNASLPVSHGTLHLKRAHIPTAWVLIEHVLRFLFHDLGVGARTHDWPAILRAQRSFAAM